jgi:hypothetical protein
MENFTNVKLEIFSPQEYALKIRDELAKIGVGRHRELRSLRCDLSCSGVLSPDGRSESI